MTAARVIQKDELIQGVNGFIQKFNTAKSLKLEWPNLADLSDEALQNVNNILKFIIERLEQISPPALERILKYLRENIVKRPNQYKRFTETLKTVLNGYPDYINLCLLEFEKLAATQDSHDEKSTTHTVTFTELLLLLKTKLSESNVKKYPELVAYRNDRRNDQDLESHIKKDSDLLLPLKKDLVFFTTFLKMENWLEDDFIVKLLICLAIKSRMHILGRDNKKYDDCVIEISVRYKQSRESKIDNNHQEFKMYKFLLGQLHSCYNEKKVQHIINLLNYYDRFKKIFEGMKKIRQEIEQSDTENPLILAKKKLLECANYIIDNFIIEFDSTRAMSWHHIDTLLSIIENNSASLEDINKFNQNVVQFEYENHMRFLSQIQGPNIPSHRKLTDENTKIINQWLTKFRQWLQQTECYQDFSENEINSIKNNFKIQCAYTIARIINNEPDPNTGSIEKKLNELWKEMLDVEDCIIENRKKLTQKKYCDSLKMTANDDLVRFDDIKFYETLKCKAFGLKFLTALVDSDRLTVEKKNLFLQCYRSLHEVLKSPTHRYFNKAIKFFQYVCINHFHDGRLEFTPECELFVEYFCKIMSDSLYNNGVYWHLFYSEFEAYQEQISKTHGESRESKEAKRGNQGLLSSNTVHGFKSPLLSNLMRAREKFSSMSADEKQFPQEAFCFRLVKKVIDKKENLTTDPNNKSHFLTYINKVKQESVKDDFLGLFFLCCFIYNELNRRAKSGFSGADHKWVGVIQALSGFTKDMMLIYNQGKAAEVAFCALLLARFNAAYLANEPQLVDVLFLLQREWMQKRGDGLLDKIEKKLGALANKANKFLMSGGCKFQPWLMKYAADNFYNAESYADLEVLEKNLDLFSLLVDDQSKHSLVLRQKIFQFYSFLALAHYDTQRIQKFLNYLHQSYLNSVDDNDDALQNCMVFVEYFLDIHAINNDVEKQRCLNLFWYDVDAFMETAAQKSPTSPRVDSTELKDGPKSTTSAESKRADKEKQVELKQQAVKKQCAVFHLLEIQNASWSKESKNTYQKIVDRYFGFLGDHLHSTNQKKVIYLELRYCLMILNKMSSDFCLSFLRMNDNYHKLLEAFSSIKIDIGARSLLPCIVNIFNLFINTSEYEPNTIKAELILTFLNEFNRIAEKLLGQVLPGENNLDEVSDPKFIKHLSFLIDQFNVAMNCKSPDASLKKRINILLKLDNVLDIDVLIKIAKLSNDHLNMVAKNFLGKDYYEQELKITGVSIQGQDQGDSKVDAMTERKTEPNTDQASASKQNVAMKTNSLRTATDEFKNSVFNDAALKDDKATQLTLFRQLLSAYPQQIFNESGEINTVRAKINEMRFEELDVLAKQMANLIDLQMYSYLRGHSNNFSSAFNAIKSRLAIDIQMGQANPQDSESKSISIASDTVSMIENTYLFAFAKDFPTQLNAYNNILALVEKDSYADENLNPGYRTAGKVLWWMTKVLMALVGIIGIAFLCTYIPPVGAFVAKKAILTTILSGYSATPAVLIGASLTALSAHFENKYKELGKGATAKSLLTWLNTPDVNPREPGCCSLVRFML